MARKHAFHRRAVMASPLIALLVIAFPHIARAQQAEYEALSKALEAARDVREEIYARELELQQLRMAGDPWTRPLARKATIRLNQEIAELTTQLAASESDYRSAVASFRRSMAPYVRIQEKAVETLDYLRKETSGNSVVRKRAIDGVMLDLGRMSWGAVPNSPNSKLAAYYAGAKEALLNGTLTGPVEQTLNDLLKDDPALQAAVNRWWNYATDFLRDQKGKLLPQEDLKRLLGPNNATMIKQRLEGLDRLYTHVEWGQRALRLYELGNQPSNPMAPPALAALSEFIDLVGDVADEFKGPPQLLTLYLMTIKPQVDGIIQQLKRLKHQLALNNLDAMKTAALTRTDEDGDTWTGLTGGADTLFGTPGPNPKIYPACTQFSQGDAISGRWVGSLRYSNSAWMGLVPSSVPHNDMKAASARTIDYVWLDGKDRGQFSFSKDLAPGSYDLRMFDSKSSGHEVQSVTIRVTARVSATAPPRSCESALISRTVPETDRSLTGTWVSQGTQQRWRIEEANGQVKMLSSDMNPLRFIGTRDGDVINGTTAVEFRPKACGHVPFARLSTQLVIRPGSKELDEWQKLGIWEDCAYKESGHYYRTHQVYVRE